MARFKIFIAGFSEQPLVEMAANDLDELEGVVSCCRFIHGEIVDDSGCSDSCRVLIPVARIQMIAEAA